MRPGPLPNGGICTTTVMTASQRGQRFHHSGSRPDARLGSGLLACYDRWRHLGGSPARHEATDGEDNEKWKAACGSCISPIKTAKQPWLSAKAAMPRSKARADCGSTFAQFTTSPAPTAHELNLKIFWSGARSRRGTWARGKRLLRPAEITPKSRLPRICCSIWLRCAKYSRLRWLGRFAAAR